VHHRESDRHLRLWARLIAYIETWADVDEVPGGLAVTLTHSPGVTRTVEVVMTPEQWESFLSVIHGTEDPRGTRFTDRVLTASVEMPYLVYDTYDWWPSHTRELREEELPAAPGGEWVARDRDGRVVSRLADWPDVRD
jgi:hypothetical protein